ncbi:MAG: response regulator, partial [Bacteroidota bacterium]
FFFHIDSPPANEFSPEIPAALRKLRLFVASAHRSSREILSTYCKSWGVWTKSAKDVREIERILENEHEFDHMGLDARLLDTQMNLLRRIRDRHSAESLPITLLCQPEDALELGKHRHFGLRFLLRPLKPSQLIPHLLDMDVKDLPGVQRSKFAEDIGEVAQRIPLKILVAEDNQINQEVAMGLMGRMGYKIDIAVNGMDAIERVRSNSYDLVFMDIQMPVLDGIEATRRIIDELGEKRPAIVAMTANAMQGDREKYMAAGMDAYVSKPILIDEVRKVIESFGPPPETEENTPATPIPEPQPEAPPMKKDSEASSNGEHQHIDLSNLMEITGGDPSFVRAILSKIVDRLLDNIDEIEELYKAGDYDQLKRSVHTLKSSSGYSGSHELRDAFQRIEHLAGSRNELQRIPKLIELARGVGTEVIAELQAELAKIAD